MHPESVSYSFKRRATPLNDEFPFELCKQITSGESFLPFRMASSILEFDILELFREITTTELCYKLTEAGYGLYTKVNWLNSPDSPIVHLKAFEVMVKFYAEKDGNLPCNIAARKMLHHPVEEF